MRNVIIVEGKTDKEFISHLVDSAQIIQIEILQGQGGLAECLDTITRRVLKQEIDKVGILLDLDDFTVEVRIQWINQHLKQVFNFEISKVNNFESVQYQGVDFLIACHFIQPNLDVLLKQVAAKPSPKADCLHACLENQNHIKQKEKDKSWLLYYMRWDICNTDERENGAKNVSFSHTYTKGAWNLDSLILNDLKAFLVMF